MNNELCNDGVKFRVNVSQKQIEAARWFEHKSSCFRKVYTCSIYRGRKRNGR